MKPFYGFFASSFNVDGWESDFSYKK